MMWTALEALVGENMQKSIQGFWCPPSQSGVCWLSDFSTTHSQKSSWPPARLLVEIFICGAVENSWSFCCVFVALPCLGPRSGSGGESLRSSSRLRRLTSSPQRSCVFLLRHGDQGSWECTIEHDWITSCCHIWHLVRALLCVAGQGIRHDTNCAVIF